jgi:hypothetical protein
LGTSGLNNLTTCSLNSTKKKKILEEKKIGDIETQQNILFYRLNLSVAGRLHLPG